MRKPRDYELELKALDAKVKLLRSARLTQLGTLVIATGADAVPIEQLAGALLSAAETTDTTIWEGWRSRGAAFFHDQGGRSTIKAGRVARRGTANDGGTASAAGDAQPQ